MCPSTQDLGFCLSSLSLEWVAPWLVHDSHPHSLSLWPPCFWTAISSLFSVQEMETGLMLQVVVWAFFLTRMLSRWWLLACPLLNIQRTSEFLCPLCSAAQVGASVQTDSEFGPEVVVLHLFPLQSQTSGGVCFFHPHPAWAWVPHFQMLCVLCT